MVERQAKLSVAEKTRNGFRKDRKQSLTFRTRDKNLTPWQLDAVHIIDSLMLDIAVKMNFFDHFLAEMGDWPTIKEFRDIREEELKEDFSKITEKIIYDNTKVALYENFHKEWSRNRAREALTRGDNYHDIHEKYDIERDDLRAMRRDLFSKSLIDLGLSEEELTIIKMRNKKKKGIEIAEAISVTPARVRRRFGKLLMMGLIEPLTERAKLATQIKRKHLDTIVDLERTGLFDRKDPKLKSEREMLINIGEIEFMRKGWKHTPEAIEKIRAKKREEASDPGYREALSERMKKIMSNPEVRAKISKSKKERMTSELKKRIGRSRKGRKLGHTYNREEARSAALKRWGKSS